MTLIYNAIQTPDGTILESRTRHDANSHTDANGKRYMVDGGLDYTHTSAHGDEVSLCVYLADGHEKVREVLKWGTYGKEGRQPLTYVLIKDMSTNHIEACLKNCRGIYRQVTQAFKDELKYRKDV